MTAAAVTACYADFKLIRTRKTCQIVCELPIEHAASFIAAFGIPDPSKETWVAIARLADVKEEKPHKRFSDLRPSAQAALRCREPEFWKFLNVTDEATAATIVRTRCVVDSRSEFDRDESAARSWSMVEQTYEAWRIAVGHGAVAA